MFTRVWIWSISATVIRSGVALDIKCEDILQGDLVKASRDCDVPCDLVLLKTSDPDAKCYITTANLDGETNLKTLFVPKGFPNDVSVGMFRQMFCNVFKTLLCNSIAIDCIEMKANIRYKIFRLQKSCTISVQSNAIDRWLIYIHSTGD